METILNKMETILNKMKNAFSKPAAVFFASWLTLLIVQWGLINIYTYICVPLAWWGVFTSAVSLGSPLCHFINTIQYEITKNYIILWSTAATVTITWIIAKLKSQINH